MQDPEPESLTSAHTIQDYMRDPKGRIRPGHALHKPRDGGNPGAPSDRMRGNLHAVKNPWATYWRRRALKPEQRWALVLVADYVPALVADKGGESNVSAAQLKVMELAAVARVCWALAMAAGDLRNVARFVAVERSCLSDLGLERRAKPVPSLSEILAESKEPTP